MNEFTGLTLDEFLDRSAERTPTPGGGSVAAAAGALACAMARMVAAYSVGKRTADNVREQVERCKVKLERADVIMRRLIEEDAVAYTNLQEAAKEARSDVSTGPAHQAAVVAAITVPMETAATASETLAVMDDFKSVASKYLLSDLGVAAVLADATARAARYSVLINLNDLTDADWVDSTLDQINHITKRCGQRCASIQAFVHDHLRSLAADLPCRIPR